MRAKVIIVGAAGGVAQLTYEVPPALAGRIQCGQRVLVPMRSRRLTGLVTEVGQAIDAGGVEPRAILELLEARPLLDRAHIELLDFIAAYYMVAIEEVYRSVIPAAARVESQRTFKIAMKPPPLALAAMTPLERAILDALSRRPATAKQLARSGDRREVAAAIVRLSSDGFIDRHDGTRGRHRGNAPPVVRLRPDAAMQKARGMRQRAIIERLRATSAAEMRLDALEAEITGARAVVRAMSRRGVLDIIADTEQPAEPQTDAAFPTAAADRVGAAPIAPPAFSPPFELTAEQSAAIAAAAPAVRERRFETFLLWGITASGKTEVYLQLAATALTAGGRVLILVPEIALADQLVRSFRERFGPLVGIAHSAQNIAERWSSWMAAQAGEARIMIGPRSVIFAPLHEPGLIVVDEEHDPAYKNEEGIRYNARDLAVALGRFARCPVMLGSATPSAESFVNARRGRYRLIRLPRRAGKRELAAVEIIDLRERISRGASNGKAPADSTRAAPSDAIPLAPALVDALRANLAAGGQSVIFLNRRGYHRFLQCQLCGNVIACSNCSVSLTFHLRDRSLRCHYCGETMRAPDTCPECAGYGLAGQGFGTERLVQALVELLPDARIERMDSDTSGRRGARTTMLDALARGHIDILAGTQMVTKGFDFPGVTLVGVVMADLALNLPDFRSAERTFQLLTQVAGRAGRGAQPGRVIIQTYAPHHYSIRAAREQDYARFIRRELELRRELMYPPFARMALVRIEGPESAGVRAIATRAAAAIGRLARPDSMRVLGPAPAPIERIKRRWRWQVVLKSRGLNELRTALAAMRVDVAAAARDAGVHVVIDVDPVNML